MARLELVAGNFGTGRAEWINYEFHLPKKEKLTLEQVASVEDNGEYLERSILGFFKGGAQGAVGLGATAAVVGIFAAPLAAVGAIGLTAAAIGGGLGALGGSVERKSLLQVTALDGRGFVAICEQDVPEEIRKAVKVVHTLRMRQLESQAEATKPSRSLWGRRSVPSAATSVAVPMIAAAAPVPLAVAALPSPPETVDLAKGEDGVFSAAASAVSSAAESAGTLAGDAYTAASDAAGDAWQALRSRLPWPGSSA